MHPNLRFICCFCIVGLIQAESIKAQSWEYALTEAEYEGSEFFDVLALDSQIIVAGARNSCHLPALWIFDRQGNLLQFKDLTPGLDSGFLYGYGKVMQLRYNDERKEIEAIGQVALADDVGGRSGFAWILDEEFDVVQTFDAIKLDPNAYGALQFAPHGYTLQDDRGSVWTLDRNFNNLQKAEFPGPASSWFSAIADGDHVYTYRTSFSDHVVDTITIYSINGDTLIHQYLTPFTHIFLLNQYLYTLGQDKLIRQYDKSNLDLVDSLFLDHENLDFSIKGESITAIGYDNGFAPTIYFLDSLLNLQHKITSSLPGEVQIVATIDRMELFSIGSYYNVRSEYGWIQQGIIPFLRNKKLADGDSIRHPSLVILDAEVLNVVEANASCEYFPPGDTLCFYGGGKPTYYELTIQNTGTDTIFSLGYHSQILGAINCAREYNYRFQKNIEILPGEAVILQDSFYLSGPQFVDTMFFYVVGPNHRLHTQPNEFAVLDLILSDQHVSDKTPLKIYPNPARDWIQLDHNTPLEQVSVVNTLGQVFFKGTVPSGNLDVSQWPAGQYFITASVRKYNYQGIFVKQ